MIPRLAATVRASVAALAADYGPLAERYAIPLDVPALFRWVVGSSATADSVNVMSHTGGGAGRWVRVRNADDGANLTDADVTLSVPNRWHRLPASTPLTANRAATLSTTNAVRGDEYEFTRLDVGAFNLVFTNAGTAGGTVATMPARSFLRVYFDGADWLHRASGLLL